MAGGTDRREVLTNGVRQGPSGQGTVQRERERERGDRQGRGGYRVYPRRGGTEGGRGYRVDPDRPLDEQSESLSSKSRKPTFPEI